MYNLRHSRARRVIENAFGVLAARWRILGRAMECCIETAEDITKACLILHNFLAANDQGLTETDRYIPHTMCDRDGTPGEWRELVQGDTNFRSSRAYTAARATQDGLAVREIFKEFFQTDQGMIHWQEQHVQRGTLGHH